MGLFSKRRDDPPRRPILTINGRPQSEPERPESIKRRARLFVECTRRLADHPLASKDARGTPIGDGLGMEELVARIAPLFEKERSLLRWVALRGAFTDLYINTIDPASRVLPFFPVVERTMGVGDISEPDAPEQVIDVSPDWAPRLTQQQRKAAIGIFAAVQARAYDYGRYSKISVDEVNRDRKCYLNDAMALDFIAWSAVALLRLGIAQQLMDVPEPDALDAPGWYTDPLFAKAKRYWDGTDWTDRCLSLGSEISTPLRPSIQFDPEGPERALKEAEDAAARRPQDWATAFECCLKGVEGLHDVYVLEQFRNRQPSAADKPIIYALTYSLRALRGNDARRDVSDGVMGATHRLRTISTAADRAGLDSSLYREGLQRLAEVAPDVDVSNVPWDWQDPGEPQVTPSGVPPEFPTVEDILAEWRAGSAAEDLARWREGMARYDAAPIENRAEMRASAELMCAALAHYLRGNNILAGSPDTDGQVPQTIWNVLVASLLGNDQTTWDAEVERHVRLALAAARRAGLQPEALGGRGTLAKIFDDTGNQMLMVAALWRLSTSGPKSFTLADWFAAAPEERAWKLP
jgi:hypothetical protein